MFTVIIGTLILLYWLLKKFWLLVILAVVLIGVFYIVNDNNIIEETHIIDRIQDEFNQIPHTYETYETVEEMYCETWRRGNQPYEDCIEEWQKTKTKNHEIEQSKKSDHYTDNNHSRWCNYDHNLCESV